jgi:hypothetical protein
MDRKGEATQGPVGEDGAFPMIQAKEVRTLSSGSGFKARYAKDALSPVSIHHSAVGHCHWIPVVMVGLVMVGLVLRVEC